MSRSNHPDGMFALNGGITVSAIEVVLVKVLQVPIIVIVALPTAAVLLAVKVNVEDPVALEGLKDAVTPFGKPAAAKLTVPVKPPCGVIVIVVLPVEPRAMVRLLAEAVSEKFPCMLTVTASVVELVRLPDVPVIVMVDVPRAAALLAVNVNVLVSVVGFGLNAAVTPVGKFEADKVTLPLNPFHAVTTTAVLAVDPCVTLTPLADADSVNVGCAPGQWFTRFAALMLPMPVAKSQPMFVP